METKSDDGGDANIQINPRLGKIQANTIGFFIAQSADEVKRFGTIKLSLLLQYKIFES